jgi:hypothetical protein
VKSVVKNGVATLSIFPSRIINAALLACGLPFGEMLRAGRKK